IRGEHHVPETSDIEVGTRLPYVALIGQGHIPEALTPKCSDPYPLIGHGDAGGRCIAGGPRDKWIGVVGVFNPPFHVWPPVVVSWFDQVEFVEIVISEFRGIHPPITRPADPLHVPVPIAPDLVVERITGRRITRGRDSQDFSGKTVSVL